MISGPPSAPTHALAPPNHRFPKAVESLAPRAPPPYRAMPIDYSKFANIEDSDEEPEKEKTKVTKTAESAAPAAKAKCANCGKEGAKMNACSVCKKVGYCSRDCQKQDWQFHKRVCKKPEPKKQPKGPKKQHASKGWDGCTPKWGGS